MEQRNGGESGWGHAALEDCSLVAQELCRGGPGGPPYGGVFLEGRALFEVEHRPAEDLHGPAAGVEELEQVQCGDGRSAGGVDQAMVRGEQQSRDPLDDRARAK